MHAEASGMKSGLIPDEIYHSATWLMVIYSRLFVWKGWPSL